jgi:periplasmic divalent cation tolerance protein
MTTDAILVLTTAASPEEAQALAEVLVEERLAACASISAPILSIYRWQGSIDRHEERQVIIKTTRARLGALEARIKTLHSYEVPEILVLPIENGSQPYLDWVAAATRALDR